jgi:hypothetical protein
MGRGGIRRRKPRRPKPERRGERDEVLDDLEDQAAWSSYTQDIPRVGNPRREHLRLHRMYRLFSDRRTWAVPLAVVAALTVILLVAAALFEALR